MSYSEWCPRCGAKIVHVTRGIPSIGRCENNHMTDRRDVLRRDPKIDWRDARIEALEAERDTLRALLVEAASDLAVYVRDEYPAESCEKYPDIARRYNRDMELVLRIRAMMEESDE